MSRVHGHVQSENQLTDNGRSQPNVTYQLGAPLLKMSSSMQQFQIQVYKSIGVGWSCPPGRLNLSKEVGLASPESFKLESSAGLEINSQGEQQRGLVRGCRGVCLKQSLREQVMPISIIQDPVKAAHRGLLLLIAPGVSPSMEIQVVAVLARQLRIN